ncbi:MAG: hypothetical protein V7676_14265 [Parasphingorhabdus sp.]|uniref:hypothetical protein n=1 Tax=Parasphingorhabdus sp. TaxID=2709688 RepID=UPI003003A574
MAELLKKYHVMVLEKPSALLQIFDRAVPKIQSDEILIEGLACGVCRTDLHISDGGPCGWQEQFTGSHYTVSALVST